MKRVRDRDERDWDSFFESDHAWKQHGDRPAEILRFLVPGDTLLDVGCGDGGLAAILKMVQPNLRIDGIEPSKVARERIEKELPWVYSRMWNGALPVTGIPSRYCSVVLASEVLEHMDDPAACISELARLARRLVIVTVPFKNSIDDQGHVWSFGIEDLHRLCESHGRTMVTTVRGRLNLLAVVWRGTV